MGNDGGSIPKRDELVKIKKKKEEAEKDDENRGKWEVCAISKEELQPPIVTCPLGFLYNKEAVLTALLENTLPSEFSHIRSLKDLINVKFEERKEKKKGEKAKFICPITKIEISGTYHKFVVVKECGCVLSNAALKEVGDIDQCPNCSFPLPPLLPLPSLPPSSSSSPSLSSLLSPHFIQLNPSKETLSILRKLLPPPPPPKLKKSKKKSKKSRKTSHNNNINNDNLNNNITDNNNDNLNNMNNNNNLINENKEKIEIKEKKGKGGEGEEEVGEKRKRKDDVKKVKKVKNLNATTIKSVEELMPKHSNPDIFRSLFTSSNPSPSSAPSFL